MATINQLANPTRFMALSAAVMPWLTAGSAVLFAVGFYGAWFSAPPDYQQGETIRIMYIHVPAAWLAMFFYTLMAMSALGALVWRHPLAEVAQKAAAPIGAAFALVCLITGALWGRPMWGTYWVWDARMTSMLVLLLIYLAIISLWRTIDEPARAGRAVSILTLVGFVNIPIIKFSVDWWNTLHQPASVFRLGGPTIHASMLWPLLVCAIAFSMFAIVLHLLSMRTEIMRRRIRTMTILAADTADRTALSAQDAGRSVLQ